MRIGEKSQTLSSFFFFRSSSSSVRIFFSASDCKLKKKKKTNWILKTHKQFENQAMMIILRTIVAEPWKERRSRLVGEGEEKEER